jgi:hypothetical protein
MPVNTVPLINGVAYGWGDIIVNINGTPLVDITEIMYKDGREKKNIYGAGSVPIKRGRGRNTPTASITLGMEAVIALQKNAPNKKLDAIAPFSIVVMYQPEAGPIVKDIITGVEFTENSRDWKEGETDGKVKLDLIIGGVKWDA